MPSKELSDQPARPDSEPDKSTDNIFLDAYHGIVKSVTERPLQAAVVTAAPVGAATRISRPV